MKHHNEIQILSLFIAALSLIVGLFIILHDVNYFNNENMFLIAILSIFAGFVVTTYILSFIKRVNPKQYIYISYAGADKETANQVAVTLDKELEKISKYRFEILTADAIPYGADMRTTMHEFLAKANIVIVIVSENYIMSEWCNEEFLELFRMDKKIIPIVTQSYTHLSRLPKDISNIKALLVKDCESDEDFRSQLILLAKDLVRQRKD